MADHDRRVRERALASSGSLEAAIAAVRIWSREGRLSRERIEVAAELGDPVAAALAPEVRPTRLSDLDPHALYKVLERGIRLLPHPARVEFAHSCADRVAEAWDRLLRGDASTATAELLRGRADWAAPRESLAITRLWLAEDVPHEVLQKQLRRAERTVAYTTATAHETAHLYNIAHAARSALAVAADPAFAGPDGPRGAHACFFCLWVVEEQARPWAVTEAANEAAWQARRLAVLLLQPATT